MKNLLCFDLDGTLVDSTKALVLTFNEVFRKNNLSLVSADEISEALGETTENIIKEFFPNITTRKMESCLADFQEIIKKHYEKIKAKPHTESTLRKLRKKGYSLAVVSNEFRKNIIEILEKSGIGFEHFDAIIGSENNIKGKSDEAFKAEKISKNKAKYLIGDSIYDIRAGKKAGVKTIAIVSGADAIKKIWSEKPSIIINKISELDSIL